MKSKIRIILGITGASGVIYGVRMLEVLAANPAVETHLILTDGAKLTLSLETSKTLGQLNQLADVVHDDHNLAAPISSGSFPVHGMMVLPCSIKSLSMIAHCQGSSLLARAADVTLKENRKLILSPRETPLHLGHLRLMTQAVEQGALLCPTMPGFYHQPTSIESLIDHSIGKILDLMGISNNLFQRWEG